MTITRDLTVEVSKQDHCLTVEVYNRSKIIDSFRTWDGTGFVKHIDHMLHDRGYARKTGWSNICKDLMTFKVDHYAN